MICCEKCFLSKVLKDIVKSYQIKGSCDFCNSTNVYIYDLNENEGLDEKFNGLLGIFRKSEELEEDNFPELELISIKDNFEKHWNIFNEDFDSNMIHRFLSNLLQKRYSDKISLLTNQVGIPQWMVKRYLEENSVLKGYKWEEFVTHIKHNNRFHNNYVNYEVLKVYLERLETIVEERVLYRGRISNDEELDIDSMGAPDPEFASAGRANSQGISHLYLANDIGTVINEIRPSLGDVIYIGTFPVPNDSNLKVIDFTKLSELDVFEFEDPTRFSVNLKTFKEMGAAISKPVRSGDSKLDYLPTQFIVDFIKSLNDTEKAGYHGIMFESTVSTSGHNVMIFDPDFLKCSKVDKKEIKTLQYTHAPYR
ncbi:RES family NAD+ phosphorylase [Exiguobacterium sp. FSL W8-0210]|uniref:RES family NAD+ phosphorylase n=1 Tax=Exiguobacterium sp. FSL W8-0210 TaxID=2921598 RepID=UPI0030F534AB